jgi:hypothetical protein
METKRMTARYFLSVGFGSCGVLFLKKFWQSSFDSVAAVALFSCIIAVAGEDQSLGPVVAKAIQRVCGACLGGFLGYIMLNIPMNLPSEYRDACLVLIPSFFCGFVQWSTKGGIDKLSKFIKANKLTHLLIQLQVGFGVVYVGSWSALTNGLMVAICRTLAIVFGIFSLLLGSIIAFPQTSLQASSADLAISLKTLGKLIVALCHDRVTGIELPPFDHRGRIFATLKTPDEHMKLLDTIETKFARGNY